jgi:large repetitive protein
VPLRVRRRIVPAVAAAGVALLAFPLVAAARPVGAPSVVRLGARIVSHPASPTRLQTARFTWKTSGTILSVRCRLDARTATRCRSGVKYSALVAGGHTFRLILTGRSNGRRVSIVRKYAWKVDLTPPTAPTVLGGSLAWSGTPVTIAASGSTDPGGAMAGYRHRVSRDGGATWSVPTAGTSSVVSASGQSLVQFEAVDRAGNTSAWAPASAGPDNTAMLDTSSPTVPTLSGALAGWQDVATESVTAAGSTDTQSGVAGYEFRTSTDGGATWSPLTVQGWADVAAEGATRVRFRALDTAGNVSPWAEADVSIDRSAPTAPAVSHNSQTWLTTPTVTPAASNSTDLNGSGVQGYVYETSTDGGSTWSAPASGASDAISAEGETLVRFASVDGVGLQSAWTQATVRVDHTAPTAPGVAGGSLSWQNAASATVTASGSTDAGGSAFTGYVYEESTNAGATWGAPIAGAQDTVSTQGERLVRFAAVDGAGNQSAWVQATVRLDTTPPTDPVVSGGSTAWKNVASIGLAAGLSTDSPGSGVAGYEYETSIDGGSTWSAATPGAGLTVAVEGETLVRFRAVDAAGFTSGWKQATVRIDRTVPTAPTASGGSSVWQNTPGITTTGITLAGSGGTDSPGSGIASYEHRSSTDGGATWSAAAAGASVTVTAQGETLVEFRAVDAAGFHSAWSAFATARIDVGAPGAPTVTGGSATWLTLASETVSAGGSTDALSGISGYQYRESADGGSTWTAAAAGISDTVAAEGQTLLQFRAVDGAGNTSAWAPAAPTSGSRVRLDRTAPTAPSLIGGSASWQPVAPVTVTASGSTDAGGSGGPTYEHRTSANGGATWSGVTSGASATISTEGDQLVAFRAVDPAGNASAWVQAPVRIDLTAPTAPTVSGGSSAWQNVTSVDVTGGGSADTGGSGVAGYEYRTSTNNGTTWSAASPGTTATVANEGATIVQFRSVDAAGNRSPWTPSPAAGASTARIDRSAPATPALLGSSAAWLNQVSSIVSASSSDAASGVARLQYQTSTDGGVNWSPVVTGATIKVTAEGETLVRFQAVDNVGLTSAFATGTVRLDVTAPGIPAVSGGSLSWQNAASVAVTASGATDVPAADGVARYDYRTSTDNGTTWSAATAGPTATISAQGVTLVQFRSVDGAGNVSAWAPASAGAGNTVKLDRGPPTDPIVQGAVAGWSNATSVTITASGSTDPTGVSYESQTSLNGGAWSATAAGPSATVSQEGTTVVRFRAVDAAGNPSNWISSTQALDHTAPVAPVVTGGSLSWLPQASTSVTASGASDALAGLAASPYQYRTSTNGGTTWSAAATGAADLVNAQGETLVEFRSVDAAGNTSAWTPAAATAGSTVRLDWTAPTAPTVTGSSACTHKKVTVSASNSTDAGGSGFKTYEYEYSRNGGAMTAVTAGSKVTFSTAGNYAVYFRGVDNAGNASAWTPGGAGFAVCIL